MADNKVKNLIIGDTSQLSHYFPEDYERISSRNIDYSKFKDKFYDRIYFCFGENRTYIEDNVKNFIDINVYYTLELIDFFKNLCNKIIVYGTSELWNDYEGGVSINMPMKWNYSPYIESKKIMTDFIINNHRDRVIILHPFNFNSFYRNGDFLFAKIFHSIIYKTPISIGDTYFYRDLIHPCFMVSESIKSTEDSIIGSGRLTFVNDFIRALYEYKGLKYNKLVTENNSNNLKLKRKIYYLNSKECKYFNLWKDTINDLKNNL